MRAAIICTISFACLSSMGVLIASAATPDHILQVWPKQPPGGVIEVGPEKDFTKDADPLIAGRRIIKLGNVSSPEAHVFLPPENLRTGASVVICPGGGFSILAWDLEGTEVAQWLNTLGVAGIVLKYRVPTRERDPMWLAPAQDAQRSLSLVRHHAERWKLDPQKVGILGFSAGGATAFKVTVTTNRLYEASDTTDSFEFRPNRTMLIYAAGLPKSTSEGSGSEKSESTDNGEGQESLVTAQTPPIFAVHTFDDFVPVQGTANLLLRMKRANVPMELHVYESGGHGYGLRQRQDQPVTEWTRPCEAWLRQAEWVD